MHVEPSFAPPSLLSDRRHAGIVLAALLGRERRPRLVIVAIPTGGVAVAFEVADALDAPLDVLPVRRLTPPGSGNAAIGAIAFGGIRVVDTAATVAREVRLVCAVEPEGFSAVDSWYSTAPSEAEAVRLLQQSAVSCAGSVS